MTTTVYSRSTTTQFLQDLGLNQDYIEKLFEKFDAPFYQDLTDYPTKEIISCQLVQLAISYSELIEDNPVELAKMAVLQSLSQKKFSWQYITSQLGEKLLAKELPSCLSQKLKVDRGLIVLPLNLLDLPEGKVNFIAYKYFAANEVPVLKTRSNDLSLSKSIQYSKTISNQPKLLWFAPGEREIIGGNTNLISNQIVDNQSVDVKDNPYLVNTESFKLISKLLINLLSYLQTAKFSSKTNKKTKKPLLIDPKYIGF